MNEKNIVIVSAHPDDFEFGMGGTAALLKEKGYFLHLILCAGGQGGIKGASPEEAGKIREKEQKAACALLDAELYQLKERDNELFAGREICEKTADIIKKIDPVAVFTQWPINVRDHSASYEIVQKALHMADIYYTNSSGKKRPLANFDSYFLFNDIMND